MTKANEYDPLGEPDLMEKDEKKVGDYFDNLGEAPDDIDQTFGKAEEYDDDEEEERDFDEDKQLADDDEWERIQPKISLSAGREDVSVSGPPAGDTIPANLIIDDEEEADTPAGEAKCPECGDTFSPDTMVKHLTDDHQAHQYDFMKGTKWGESIENILNEADFKEDEHPRDHGKFTKKGGGTKEPIDDPKDAELLSKDFYSLSPDDKKAYNDANSRRSDRIMGDNELKDQSVPDNILDLQPFPDDDWEDPRGYDTVERRKYLSDYSAYSLFYNDENKSLEEIASDLADEFGVPDAYARKFVDKSKATYDELEKTEKQPTSSKTHKLTGEPMKDLKTLSMFTQGDTADIDSLTKKQRLKIHQLMSKEKGYGVNGSSENEMKEFWNGLSPQERIDFGMYPEEKAQKNWDELVGYVSTRDNKGVQKGGQGDKGMLGMMVNKTNDPTMSDYWNQIWTDKGKPDYSGLESYSTERDFYTSNKQIDDQAWEIMAEEEFGKSVSELNDAQYDWIDQIMHDYGNNLDRSKKPSSESYTVKDNEDNLFASLSDLDEATKLAEKLHAMVVNEETAEIMYVSPIYGTGADLFESKANEEEINYIPEGTLYPDALYKANSEGNTWMRQLIEGMDKNKLSSGDKNLLASFLGEQRTKSTESVTSWWGGKSPSSLEFRSKVLERAGVYTGFQDKEFWELPEYVQDKVFELYSGGYVGEAKLKAGYIQCPHCDQQFSNIQWLSDHIDEIHEGKETKANEFQPERQGKRVKLLTGDYAGKTGTIATVEIIGDGFTVRVDGVHNEYETGVNASPSEVEFLGGEAVLDTASNNGYDFSVIDSGYGELEVAIFSPEKTSLGTQKSIAKGWLTQSEVDEIKSMFQRDPEGTYKMLGGEAEPAGYYGFGSATGRMPPPEDWKQGGDMYKPSSSMFSDFRNSGLTWNELPTDIQDAWKSERDYMVNEELEGEATPESDVEELSKLNQLYKNEEEEQAQGEDETEDLELVSDLMDMELEEIGTEEFREDEHPRDHGKFTTKGGGDAEQNKILDDPSSSKQERIDAEKGLGKKDDVPTAEPKKEPKKEEPKYSHTKPNNPKRFNTIKSRVLKALGEPKDDWGKRYTDRVEKLEGFPTSGYQLEDLSVKYKSPILKAHLMDQHPNSKWSVKSEYFSMGSSVNASYIGGEYPYGASEIGDVYSQRGAGYDSQTDYFPIDNYSHVYDQRENQPRGDPQTIAKDRPDRLWSWVNLKFDEENDYDSGRTWSRHIAEDLIKGKGTLEGGYQGVNDEMMGKIKQVYNDFVEQERKEKAGESYAKEGWDFPTCPKCGSDDVDDDANPYLGAFHTPEEIDKMTGDQKMKCDNCGAEFTRREYNATSGESFKKKLSEFEDSDRPVSPNTLQRYSEPIDLPNGKNALDQTYGVSEPETPDGQDLTGITVGEEEIIEKKPPKIKYYYYKQYPFGRRAGKQNPFGEANEVSLRVMNKAHQWWDSKYPDRQWKDMGIGERQNVILAFLRDPTTKILGESYAEEWMMDPQEDIDLPRIRELQDKIDAGTATLPEHNEMVDLVRTYVPMDNPDISLPYANPESNPQYYESHAEEFDSPIRDQYGNPYPTPEGIADCTFCGKVFDNWDLLGDHITIVHNDQGRTREFYDGEAPSSILNHPDWTGYAGEGGKGSGRKPTWKSEDPKTKEKHHVGWKNYGIDDYLEKAEKEYEEGEEGRWDNAEGDDLEKARIKMEAEKELLDTSNPTHPIKGGMDYQEGGEQAEDVIEDEHKMLDAGVPEETAHDLLKVAYPKEGEERVIDEPRENMSPSELEDWQQRRYKEYEQDQKASDYLEKIKYSTSMGGAKYQRGGEQFEDPTPWASLAQLGATTVKDILFPEKEESEEQSFADMTDKELEELGDLESTPHQAEEDTPIMNKGKVDVKKIAKNKTLITPAKEGGRGSGKKGHTSWMRAIEEEHTYDFCENCSMITEQVNSKCDMCGKKVE